MILVDSDIIIQVSRGRDASIARAWSALEDDVEVLACSPVTVAELWHGVRPNELEALTRLVNALVCLPLGPEIGRVAGNYLSHYHRSHGLSLGDALIAATASVHGADLWTRNRKHFPMKDLSFFHG